MMGRRRSVIQPNVLERLNAAKKKLKAAESIANNNQRGYRAKTPSLAMQAKRLAKKGNIALQSLAQGTVVIGSLVFYAYVLIPAFRKADTLVKSAIVLLLHPALQEGACWMMRKTMGRKKGHDVFKDHFALFALDSLLSLIRRFLVFGVGDRQTTAFTVLSSGIVEVGLRATMIQRDRLLRWTLGIDEPSKDALEREMEVYGAQVNVSTMSELISICMGAVMQMMFYDYRFVWNLSFSVHDSVHGLDVNDLVVSTAFMLFVELLTDWFAFWLEDMQGIPVLGFFERFDKPASHCIKIESFRAPFN